MKLVGFILSKKCKITILKMKKMTKILEILQLLKNIKAQTFINQIPLEEIDLKRRVKI